MSEEDDCCENCVYWQGTCENEDSPSFTMPTDEDDTCSFFVPDVE